jgi:hypothetical protein
MVLRWLTSWKVDEGCTDWLHRMVVLKVDRDGTMKAVRLSNVRMAETRWLSKAETMAGAEGRDDG